MQVKVRSQLQDALNRGFHHAARYLRIRSKIHKDRHIAAETEDPTTYVIRRSIHSNS